MSAKNFFTRPLETIPISGAPDPALMSVHSVAVGPEGRFYLSDEFNHRIVVLNATGDFLTTFGEKGAQPGQFWYPRGISFVNNKSTIELVVCDAWNHRIQRFTPEGKFLSVFGSIGEGDDNFNEPVTVIPDENGTIWILDSGNSRIKKHSIDGTLLGAFGKRMLRAQEDEINDPVNIWLERQPFDSGYNYPTDFTRLDDGSFMIADTGNRRLVNVNSDGVMKSSIRLDIEGKPPYRYPLSVSSVMGGVVYVSFVNSQGLLLDADRRWIRVELEFASEPGGRQPVLALKKGEDKIEMVVVDGRQGVIERYELSIDNIFEPVSQLAGFPGGEALDKIPNKWTELDGDDWTAYLKKGEHSEIVHEQALQYLESCKRSASLAAQKLIEVEGELCQILVRLYDAKDKMRLGVVRGAAADEMKTTRETLNIYDALQRRTTYRRALVEDIARAVDILTGNATAGLAAGERSVFADLLKSEYTQRKNNFDEIVKWLRDSFVTPDSVNMKAVTHAFTAIFYLLDHFKYLTTAISKLDASLTLDAIDSIGDAFTTILAGLKGDVGAIASEPEKLLGLLCEKWGFFDTAEAAYLRKVEQNHPSNEVYARLLTGLFQKLGKFEKAKPLLDKFAKKGISNMATVGIWEGYARTQKIMTQNPPVSITLSCGLPVREAIGITGAKTPGMGDGLRYVKSLAIMHPERNMPLRPFVIEANRKQGLAIMIWGGRGLVLCDGNGSSRLIKPDFGRFCGMGFISDEQMLLAEYVPEMDKCSLFICTASSGAMEKIDFEAASSYETGELFMVSAGEAGFVIRENQPFRVWFLGHDLKTVRPLEIPDMDTGSTMMNVHEDNLYISYLDKNAVYRIKTDGSSGLFLDSRYLVSPVNVTTGIDGTLYISNHFGVGLQAYSSQGECLYTITSLTDGEQTYYMGPFASCKAEDGFMGGDILLADSYSNNIHVFSSA